MTATEIAILMRKFSAAIEVLPEEQIQKMLADDVFLGITCTQIRSPIISNPPVDVSSYVALLDAANDRVSGINIVKDLNKTSLLTLAKTIHLSVDGSMTKDRLIEKIVERSVGLRLLQDAFAQIN